MPSWNAGIESPIVTDSKPVDVGAEWTMVAECSPDWPRNPIREWRIEFRIDAKLEKYNIERSRMKRYELKPALWVARDAPSSNTTLLNICSKRG